MRQTSLIHYIAVLISLLFIHGASASDTAENPLRDLFFGETHVHTAYSLDAYIGGTRQTPSDAYRAAKGEAVVVNGLPHRLRRPLDFAAVTDHAEYMGEMYSAINRDAPGHNQPLLKQLRELTDVDKREQWFFRYVVQNNRGKSPKHPEFYAGTETLNSAWQLTIDAANEHYEPGKFTTLVAYEWSAAPGGANLHRNILFRSDRVPTLPASYIDTSNEEALWSWLDSLEKAGIRAMAIPHNSNASKGKMFSPTKASGDPIDRKYAQARAHFERAIEIMQVKGNSEVHPDFWAADEFANFENADSIANYSGRKRAKENYVRHAIGQGLQHKQVLGANPYKLGFVGGSDSHNGTMGDVDEENYVGGHGTIDGTVEARRNGSIRGWIETKDLNPGTLTGAWATSNTREAIWDSIYNRETFATSGPRIAVRMFGGWSYKDDLHLQTDAIEQAYAGGVPMGGDLKKRISDSAPKFMLLASKDALGANLDRAQIVKGWVDNQRQIHDKVFDVVWSDSRELNAAGRLPNVGNTVDLATATYRNTIGNAQLSATWEDPEFDPGAPSVYYMRVLEIPTPRWSTYDAVRSGLPLLDDVPALVQERAWSSPIWYQPQK